jgi:uncharacterized membrane protein YbaN (DUF454 family)
LVYEISGCVKSLIPEFQEHGGMSKKSKTHLHNVVMFMFSISILLMSMRARHGKCEILIDLKKEFNFSYSPLQSD